jgi:hypothetical protein|tara:strand:- start:31333 stop:31767 length:435 start_codon:yes stop_codon:yes gene_type:complete
MGKEDWIWMPHAGHFILGHNCRFRLCTYVGKYIVSTVGELWQDTTCQKIHAEVYDPKWYEENKHLKGDDWEFAFKKEFGYFPIGPTKEELYESFVGIAKESEQPCCKYEIDFEKDCDFNDGERYATAKEAYEGHLALCEKWSRM